MSTHHNMLTIHERLPQYVAWYNEPVLCMHSATLMSHMDATDSSQHRVCSAGEHREWLAPQPEASACSEPQHTLDSTSEVISRCVRYTEHTQYTETLSIPRQCIAAPTSARNAEH